jgi:hypothetical protein
MKITDIPGTITYLSRVLPTLKYVRLVYVFRLEKRCTLVQAELTGSTFIQLLYVNNERTQLSVTVLLEKIPLLS